MKFCQNSLYPEKYRSRISNRVKAEMDIFSSVIVLSLFSKYYFYWLYFYIDNIHMHDRKFLLLAIFSHVVVLICRELHVQICSMEACNKISITHCKPFCSNHSYKTAKCFLAECFLCICYCVFCSEM